MSQRVPLIVQISALFPYPVSTLAKEYVSTLFMHALYSLLGNRWVFTTVCLCCVCDKMDYSRVHFPETSWIRKPSLVTGSPSSSLWYPGANMLLFPGKSVFLICGCLFQVLWPDGWSTSSWTASHHFSTPKGVHTISQNTVGMYNQSYMYTCNRTTAASDKHLNHLIHSLLVYLQGTYIHVP